MYHQIPQECAIMFYTQCIQVIKKPDTLHNLPASLHPHKQAIVSLSDSIRIQGNITDMYIDWETTLLQCHTGSEVHAK